ncbi:MAG: GDSL-type esterase/lipase family protein [Planctomycetes bacterium]|nr:GDSL-type esterase/lipase family protein [Planctomycetota bacterium]
MSNPRHFPFLVYGLISATFSSGSCAHELPPEPRNPQVALNAGDHISILGSGFADRTQHHGWLETFLHSERPDLQLSIRNLGLTGDRINHRPRNQGFPSPDEYLTLCKTNVIFAMFGFNESFDGKPDEFEQEVEKWVAETLAKDYSGNGAPQIVLFSPIAHEDLQNPNYPNGRENNLRLGAYSEAIRDAAVSTGVGFVDLFSISQKLYRSHEAPLTENGIHPTEFGSRVFGEQMAWSLLGNRPKMNHKKLADVRKAVLHKNWFWFNRYRATDGNDVWGGRSHLKFTDGQTNRTVLMNELKQLVLMTDHEDSVIWSVAQGTHPPTANAAIPKDIPVISNIGNEQLQGGRSKTGSTDYMSPEESLEHLTLDAGIEAGVFASEVMFPELVNPVGMGVDTQGRLWVAAWKTYPKWKPTGEMEDRLLILPDSDRDGVADKAITFAKVHNPTGFEFWNGGVIVVSAPDILFLKDTDGDDVADIRIRILSGLDSADTHHAANNLIFGPDGFIYFQRGVFHVSNVESPWSTNQESTTSGMYRFNPRTSEFSFHAPNSPNPHGISFDYWGYHFATDGTGGRAFQVKPNGKGGFQMRKLLDHTVRPVPASEVLSSAHFPPEMQGRFLILNSIAFLGIKQYDLSYNTETGEVNGTEIPDLLVSEDRNFRPTDFVIGEDGAGYVSDWSNAIIGHMQHNVRDPNRDHAHGRILRLTVPGRELSPRTSIDGESIAVLLDHLKHPINGVRQRARVELSERDTAEVIKEAKKWLEQFDPQSKEDAHHLLEGLWLHQQHNVVDQELLSTLLQSPEPHARIAAQTVRQFWEHNSSKPVDPALVEAEGTTQEQKPDEDAIVIRAVPEEMLFDVTSFTVKSGQPVKIWFANPDFMPHNLILGVPGSAEEIGKAAEALGSQGFARSFIPDSDKVLAATKLINYQEHAVLEFTAPTVPGDYDYLCTFPGHWMRMRGIMKVR